MKPFRLIILIAVLWLTGCSSMVLPRNASNPIPSELKPRPDTADEMVVYVIPAPVKINYGSPRAMLLSFVAAGLDFTEKSDTKHLIGHVFFRLRSGGKEVLTGQTTDGSQEEKDVVYKHGYGLGYLGTAFIGRLDDGSKLRRELEDRFRTGEMAYMRFLLSPDVSARMMRYFEEYRDRGYAGWWGEANRPRYREGGACASFAVSVLDVGGLLNQKHTNAWTINLRIPKTLYGGPLFDQFVPFERCIARTILSSRWARADEEYIHCLLWEPTKIHSWLVKAWEQERKTPSGRYILEQTERVRGLVIDARHMSAPNGPLWLDPLTAPNLQGRQPGSRARVERPEAFAAMQAAMKRQRQKMRE